MQKILTSVLAACVYLTPLTVTLITQPSWGETKKNQAETATKLLEQAIQKGRQQEYQQAIPIFQQVLVIVREQKDQKLEALVLNELGFCYNALGEKQKALSSYNQALLLYRAVGDRAGEATTLNNIGAVYNALGEKQQALSFYNQALPLIRAVGDRSRKATTLNNIGLVYSDLGEKQQALSFFNQALPLWRAVGNRAREAGTLNNIGSVYNALGEKQKALSSYNQALPLSRAVGDRSGEAVTLHNIGTVYWALGEKQQALSFYNQALPLYRAVGNRSGIATTFSGIGLVYSDLGQKQQALSFYNQALTLWRAVGDRSGEATTLNNIGVVYSDLGEKEKALKFYNQALPLRRAVGDRFGEANTLGHRGILFHNTNRPSKAITDLEKFLQINLEIRRSLQQENRQKFLQQNDWSAALVNVLIDQKKYDQAFAWVNLFSTTDLADYNRLINAKVANPQTQQAINNWNLKNQQLEAQRQQLQNNFSADVAQKFRQLETQVYQQATEISRQFPEVAELFETTPADIDQLKSSIPADTVVIQPVLLTNLESIPKSLAIFILTKNKVTVIKTLIKPDEFDQLLTQYLEQVENDGDPDYAENSVKLYDILIRPVEAEIQKLQPKQLSIIATGKLRYLPFETLRDSKTEKYLIQKYPVNYLTRISTSSLGSLKETTNQLPKVLAFGNPVSRDPQNLPGAEIEVNEITKKLSGSEAYLGNKATLANFKNQALRFNLVHLATHGCFQNTDCKELNLKNNSLLFADTQFNIADAAFLGLKGTQLLTLSACQTAKKIDDKGVGIAGVAYIFERAGAKAVMASLWAVEDESTQKLMVDFYANLQQGMSKGEALQKAKLKQIDRHPFYWSPFVIIGDAR
ncbi:tetratricopeptide repeat protein [Fortiea sp. LEGE XX443]|uniref:CHAT domain-containing protein n=1 Tax=Fortiea sp. LEGE XX443 TaxID=1828611 RepID=UPI001882E287|nr:tetratricopeptide repeat protein [Fortiea sp. LEGE XX443]MBE9005563.1 tetratricopeptide repeat protein [Fortiea sp. LEGE XX443]